MKYGSKSMSSLYVALPDLGHLGASLADDAADEFIGYGHFVGLMSAGRPTLTRKQGKSCAFRFVHRYNVTVKPKHIL
jgi:hypothetical protein